MSNNESLIAEFAKSLGDKPYFTGKQLIDLGLFGSATGISKALNNGVLPFIRVSKKRRVVPRSAVVQYFQNNLVKSV